MRLGLGLGVTAYRRVVSVAGGGLAAWDDPEASPLAFLSVNADYADTAALLAAYAPIFTDVVDTDTGVVDDSVLYEGHKAVRIDMAGFNGYFEVDVTTNPEPSAELICKRIVRFDNVTSGVVETPLKDKASSRPPAQQVLISRLFSGHVSPLRVHLSIPPHGSPA